MERSTITLGSLVITALATIWVVSYLALGRPVSAAIPFGYQLLSVFSIWALRRRLLGVTSVRAIQLAAMLVLPFALHASLGGFHGSAGVSVWALSTPLLAFLYGASSTRWMVAFSVIAIAAAIGDPTLEALGNALDTGLRPAFYALNFVGFGFAIHLGILHATAERERRSSALQDANQRIETERARADSLLAAIMPADIAERLKSGEQRIADQIASVSVLIADVVGFTPLALSLSPGALVEIMDDLWSRFDEATDRHGLEKIKSVGDSYLVVGGRLSASDGMLCEVADLGLEMCEIAVEVSSGRFGVRVGIAHGPVVAGVIGTERPSFGLWGDTVNTASRMESTGVPGRVQVTGDVARLLEGDFVLEPRGSIEVKGKGSMSTYLLEGRAV